MKSTGIVRNKELHRKPKKDEVTAKLEKLVADMESAGMLDVLQHAIKLIK